MGPLLIGGAALLLLALAGKKPQRRSGAQEGQPLTWDESEHPAAQLPARTDAGSQLAELHEEHGTAPSAAQREADATLGDQLTVTEVKVDIGEAVLSPAAPAALPPPAPPPAARENKPRARTRKRAVPVAPRPPAALPPPAPPPPAPAGPQVTGRSAKDAAADLFEYVTAELRAGRGSGLGTKGKPNAVVRAAQRDMGGVAEDGIYGPDTKARGKQLIGKTFPVRK